MLEGNQLQSKNTFGRRGNSASDKSIFTSKIHLNKFGLKWLKEKNYQTGRRSINFGVHLNPRIKFKSNKFFCL